MENKISRLKTIVSVSGYGATGSSAVIDFLKGYEQVSAADKFEFQIHYLPDGISDLDYKLNESCCRFYDSDVAINRFLALCKELEKWYEPAFHGHLYEMANEYIDSLELVKWNGYWAWDRLHTPREQIDKVYDEISRSNKVNSCLRFANRFLRKLKLPQIKYLPVKEYSDIYKRRQMYMSIKPVDFIERTKLFSETLVSKACDDSQAPIIVVNQLLPPQNPQKYQKYFSSKVKSIVTLRDPRDVFLHAIQYHWPVVPYEDAHTFVAWYRENLKHDTEESVESVLRIYFEDLVYEYEATAKRILDFVGIFPLSEAKVTFDPHMSVINTQMFKRYPQYYKEIQIIEDELSEYLYDFDNHNPVSCMAKDVFDSMP